MSRKFGAFDPAATASTTVVTLTTTARGIVEAVAQNFFPFESTAANLASGDGVFTSVGAFSYSSAVGTPYGPGTALRVEGNPHMEITSAGAVQMVEFSSAFTFEFWAYQSSGANDGYRVILDSRNNGGNPNNCFNVQFGLGKLRVSPGASGGANIQESSTVAALNVWQHYAIARDSSMQMRMFFDGVKTYDASYTIVSDNKATGGRPHFFESVNGSYSFTGYIRDLRIFKDICIYTTAFPVTTQPLQATSNNIVISTTTTINTRSHSHVWNYPDIYKARRADTWPDHAPVTRTIQIHVAGGGGGGGSHVGGDGGDGVVVSVQKSGVTAGTILTYVVGGGGKGGFHGGGRTSGQVIGITSGPMQGGGALVASDGDFQNNANQSGAEGGAGSGVFLSTATQANAIVIAGGGGGGAGNNAGEGGAGGGQGTAADSSLLGQDGQGGTNQGEGGQSSRGGRHGNGTSPRTTAGALLGQTNIYGGSGYTSGGGGGGGYYGGGGGGHGGSAGDMGGAGGGSGYVSSEWTRIESILSLPAGGANATTGSDGANGKVVITVDGSTAVSVTSTGTTATYEVV